MKWTYIGNVDTEIFEDHFEIPSPEPLAEIRVSNPSSVNLDVTHRFDRSHMAYIGDGVYATVYQATLNKSTVACKEYYPNGSHEYHSEKEILTLLKHPNIIGLLGHIDSSHIILLELAQFTLADYLLNHQNETRDPLICKKYATDMLFGLYYLHAQGFVHRDIKPDNILIVTSDNDTEGTAKLGDFNLSKQAGRYVRPGGTPGYRPPEGYESEEIPAELFTSYDIPSIALVLYLLTTAAEQRPPLSFIAMIKIFMFLQDPRPHFPRVPGTASPELQWMIHKALHAAPERRPTAAELLQVVRDPNVVFRIK